jgi:hypothetical protein
MLGDRALEKNQPVSDIYNLYCRSIMSLSEELGYSERLAEMMMMHNLSI